jgi:secondary thiamine-phosphate synthase enzyme
MELSVRTRGQGLYEITREVREWVAGEGAAVGLLTLFIRHTSASLLIQENADPEVQRDLAAFFGRIVPEDPGLYAHAAEGPDDMPGHIRSALTQTQLSIPVRDKMLSLGTWQGIFVFEHRAVPQTRHVVLHLLAE